MMTRVYLAQHAKAFDKEQNEERPLTPEGERDATQVAELLKDQVDTPENIYHSSKLRAGQTASIFREHFAPNATIQEIDGLQPLDDPSIIADRINSSSSTDLYVGHLPHMSKLAAYLINGDADQPPISFNNGGIICLENTDDGWQVDWIVTPTLVGKPESPSAMFQ